VREQSERLRFEDRRLVFITGKPANVIKRVKPRDGDECDVAVLETAQNL